MFLVVNIIYIDRLNAIWVKCHLVAIIPSGIYHDHQQIYVPSYYKLFLISLSLIIFIFIKFIIFLLACYVYTHHVYWKRVSPPLIY